GLMPPPPQPPPAFAGRGTVVNPTAASTAAATASPRPVFPKNPPTVIYPSGAWTLALVRLYGQSLIIRILSSGYSPTPRHAPLAPCPTPYQRAGSARLA